MPNTNILLRSADGQSLRLTKDAQRRIRTFLAKKGDVFVNPKNQDELWDTYLHMLPQDVVDRAMKEFVPLVENRHKVP
ncbi:MAG: hypothetical protein ACYDEV_04230 [Acidiferrobacter sp.]